MPILYLVRHAVAQDRSDWSELDSQRPLTSSGWHQAAELAERLQEPRIQSFVSSPTVRCRDTILPLAHLHSSTVQDQALLRERPRPLPPAQAATLLTELLQLLFSDGSGAAAACSHGDVLPALLQGAGMRGVIRCPKAGIWRLLLEAGSSSVAEVSYLGRPLPHGGWED